MHLLLLAFAKMRTRQKRLFSLNHDRNQMSIKPPGGNDPQKRMENIHL
jgi:hypothetical protein